MEQGKQFDLRDLMLAHRIEDLDIVTRTLRLLQNQSIFTIGELCKMTERQLSEIKEFGDTAMADVKSALAEYQLSLAKMDYHNSR